MNYVKASEIRDIVNEIELNNKDTRILMDAIKDGIVAAQITIRCPNGTYMTTIFENDRINLLLQTLYTKNKELMEKLEEY